MAPADQATAQQEPSMEDILASIRKIITTDEKPAPAAVTDDVLELTDVVEEAPSMPEESPSPMPSDPAPVVTASMPEPEPPATMQPIPAIVAKPALADEGLVSTSAADAAGAAFATLSETLQREYTPIEGNIPMGDGNRTLEGMVIGLLRPMLKEWLDSNLPPLVEKIVQREIQRIVRKNAE